MSAELANNPRDILPANIGGDVTQEVETSTVPFWRRRTTRRVALELTGIGVGSGVVIGS